MWHGVLGFKQVFCVLGGILGVVWRRTFFPGCAARCKNSFKIIPEVGFPEFAD